MPVMVCGPFYTLKTYEPSSLSLSIPLSPLPAPSCRNKSMGRPLGMWHQP